MVYSCSLSLTVRKGNIRDWNWKDTLSLLCVEKAVPGISVCVFEVRDIPQGGSQPWDDHSTTLYHVSSFSTIQLGSRMRPLF